MIYKKIFFLLLLVAGSCLPAKSQVAGGAISGTVLEAGTDKPLANVSMNFDGTLNGTSTDKVGNFTLYPKANNKIPLIVSAVGYLTETITEYTVSKKMVIYLKARTYDLDAVTITASDGMSRPEKMRIFRREFLGTLSNARNCEILNEKDIRLTYNKKTNTVKAFSDNPIIIRNKNLGYTVKFFPKDITVAPDQTTVQGYQFFGDDAALATSEKIQRARENTYLGSQIHFIRSLWTNDLEKNGFQIFKHNNKTKLTYDDLVVTSGNQKYIRLKGSIDILYGKKISVLFNTEDKDIAIDRDGYNDPIGITWSGFISTQRAADLLPLEYKNNGISKPERNIASADTLGIGKSVSGEISHIISSVNTLRNRMLAEKLYIQFDKPYYSVGDTIWMKAYLFSADFLRASEKSGIAYIELANDTNKVLLQRMLPIEDGLGAGNLVLNKEDIPEGSYTIRAYTNLMRNFGEDLVFKKNLYISGSAAQNWLVNFNPTLTSKSGKDSLQLSMQFNQFDKKALGLHDMELRVLEGRRTLFRDKVQTDADGKMDVNFTLPEKADVKNISIVASDPRDLKHTMTIPIRISRPENTDLQFMPEGGNLVTGIPSVIGFKAIGEDGKGVEVSGKIYSSSSSQEVAVFNSSHKGMGAFELTPKTGEIYTAKVVLNGVEKRFPLPAVKSLGTAIRVVNTPESDSLEVTVSSNLTDAAGTVTAYLVAQARGIICFGAVIRINRNSRTMKIAKNLFPTGITRFTLLSSEHQPLNERIIFIDHHDNLTISIDPSKAAYKTRDNTALAIEVKDAQGNPVKGSFSFAVTDNNQVKTDSLGNNILTSLLLTSDLKGDIEDPGHYFQSSKQAVSDLDLLMLTQGWVGYDWKDVSNPPVPKYQAESEFVVKGRVSNVFNRNSAGTGLRLLSIKPFMMIDTVTNKDGSFVFSDFPTTDSLSLVIQARNKNDRSFNIGIEIDEFKPPVFNKNSQRFMPWYVNADTSMVKYITTAMDQRREQLDLPKGTNMLEEVNIVRKKIVKGSKNLNGDGGADVVLDEADMRKAKSMTLFELLQKRFNIKKQLVGTNRVDGTSIYRYLYGVLNIRLVIDGWGNRLIPYPIDTDYYMNYFMAEDIIGIEIMSSDRFAFAYDRNIAFERVMSKMFTVPVFFEITTRAGKGPFMRRTQGTNMYKPMPFAGTQQFYSPKYTTTDKANGKDQRSTIHWEPNINTDSDGKATVSFYSADNPGTYSIILEGTDMNGNIGRQTGSITIQK
jgi:hypothetical protein